MSHKYETPESAAARQLFRGSLTIQPGGRVEAENGTTQADLQHARAARYLENRYRVRPGLGLVVAMAAGIGGWA